MRNIFFFFCFFGTFYGTLSANAVNLENGTGPTGLHDEKQPTLHTASCYVLWGGKALVDLAHKGALAIIKSPWHCLAVLSSLASVAGGRPSNACPSHIVLREMDEDLRSAFDTCYQSVCSTLWQSSVRPCPSIGPTFDLPRCRYVCGARYPTAQHAATVHLHSFCRYKACNQIAIPDLNVPCSTTYNAISANRCFAQRFCEKKIRVACAPDQNLGFWDKWAGKTHCDTHVCPGFYTHKTDLPEAEHIKDTCIVQHCTEVTSEKNTTSDAPGF